MKRLVIAIDLDNTLCDEFGRDLRPGARRFLGRLAADGHELVLWTHSTRARAGAILDHHGLAGFFARTLCREDYDAEGPKELRRIAGQVLIDDDPAQIAAAREAGLSGVTAIEIAPYRGGPEPDPGVFDRIYEQIRRRARPWPLRWPWRR